MTRHTTGPTGDRHPTEAVRTPTQSSTGEGLFDAAGSLAGEAGEQNPRRSR